MDAIRMLNAGEQGLVVEFGQTVDKDINFKVHRLTRLIRQELAADIIEVVPTYRSLLIYFNPLSLDRQVLQEKIAALAIKANAMEDSREEARVIYIPVCYGGEFGPDLAFVAGHNGLTEDEVIQIHTSQPYLVYMLGFTPGYAYLGGMSEKIATPRLEKPRTKVPEGSVGIGGSQTAFYTIESPGGWQLIGRTPIKAFDFRLPQPFLFEAGDYLHFQAVDRTEYEAVAAEISAGRYKPVISSLKGGGNA